MKPAKTVTSQPRLKLLLAVKGRIDNIELSKPIKLFKQAKIELTNPRTVEELVNSLPSQEYDLVICDHQLITKRSFTRLVKLGHSETAPPLITFAHSVDSDKLEQAKTIQSLYTFVVEELDSARLHKLMSLALRYALLNQSQSRQPDLTDTGQFQDTYSYYTSVHHSGRLQTDWISDSFHTVTGYSKAEVNRKGGWISFVSEEDLPSIKQFIATLMANKSGSVTYRVKTKKNQTIWLESVGQPKWDKQKSRVIAVNGYTRDVTEREQLKHTLKTFSNQQAAITKIGELAATAPQQLYKETTLLITQNLSAWFCEIFLFNENAGRATLETATGLEPEATADLHLPMDKNNEVSYLLNIKSAFISDDLRREKRFKPSTHLRKQKALSGICAPLKSGDRILGMLAVYSNQAHAFSDDNMHFVQSIATMLGVLSNQQSHEFQLRSTRDVLVEQTQQLDKEVENTLFTSKGPSHDDDISVIVKTAKELRSRDKILSAMSKATQALIEAPNWQNAMNKALQELGHAANVSRAYLFINHTDLAGDQLASLSFEWVNTGIEPSINKPAYKMLSLTRSGLTRFEEILSHGGVIVGQIEDFAKSERAYFKKLNVKSTAIVPVSVENKWWGFLGFDVCEQQREWSSAEIDALRIAAGTIATALERRQNESALQTVLEGTAGKAGEDYFRSLLKHLAGIFEADFCLIAEAAGDNRYNVRNALHKTEFLSPFEYRQKGDAFTANMQDDIIHFPNGVYKAFPENKWLKNNKIEGYLAIPILDNDKNVLGHIAVMSTRRLDINIRERQVLKIFAARVGVEMERQSMEAENRQLARISLENPNMVMTADLDGRILFSNPACTRMQERLGLKNVEVLLPENHTELIKETLSNENQTTSTEHTIKNFNIQWNYYLQNDLQRVQLYAIDLTQYRLIENQLRKDAFQDYLTGLPNRNFFNKLLTHATERTTRRDDYSFAVLFLDLDRFKYINDSLGHAYGDKFLETVAQLLKNCLRPGDYIARFGGDEFAILLDGVTDEREATTIADRIQQTLSRPILLDQHETFTSASIGIVLSTRGYNNPQDMLRDADIAMYSAKQSGKAKYTVFDARMHEDMVHVLRLETDLRNALKNNELVVYYQPIYSISEKRMVGMEALVRWCHPQKGFLEPDDFVPLAEEMSIIREIDYLVLNEATRQLKDWREKYTAAESIRVNVNLSAVHFNTMAILAEIGNVLKDNQLPNDALRLELTEGVLMSNTSRSAEIFKVLNKLGVKISIDDFGVGYSSLSRLTKLPVDMLKIDRGFVQSMIVDSTSLNITRAIIDLAHDLNMEVIAEGVETQGQFQILGRMGCHYAQGYYISKPLTKEETEKFIINPPELS